MIENSYFNTDQNIHESKTKAALVGLSGMGISEYECELSLDELERLLDTAGGEVKVRLVQNKENPDVRTFL